jgi:hypothetical protein
LFALLVVIVAAPAAAASHGLTTGLYLGPDFTAQTLAFQRAHAAGTTVVRLQLHWSDVAPVTRPAGFQSRNPDDPSYRWASMDALVELAEQQGLKPLITVYDAPSWAQAGKGYAAAGGFKVSAKQFGDFAFAAATHYDGTHGVPRVSMWQAWNEPNVNVYLEPQFNGGREFSPGLYRSMLNAFATAIHAVHAGNVVVGGGLSPFTVKSGATVTIGPLEFTRQVLCMSNDARPHSTCSATTAFDAWATNPYTSGAPTHSALNPNDVSLGDLPKLRSLLDAAWRAHHVSGHGRPRLWVTEFSWDSSPPDPKGVPLALHARWTAEALYRMWASGVDLAIWLTLRDEAFPAAAVQGGLYFRGSTLQNDRPKPALTAFTFPFVAYLAPHGVRIWARTPWGKAATIRVERRSADGWQSVATLHTDRFGIGQKTIRGSFAAKDSLRATVGTTHSLAFSLTQPPDRTLNPFGS